MWDAPFSLGGQVAIGARPGSEPVGEGGGEPARSPPEGICANIGVYAGGDCGLARHGSLAIEENSPQVEEEARYEPVRRLRQHERAHAENKRGHLRRLHTAFRKSGNFHPRYREFDHQPCALATYYGLQAAGTV